VDDTTVTATATAHTALATCMSSEHTHTPADDGECQDMSTPVRWNVEAKTRQGKGGNFLQTIQSLVKTAAA
jgi:hypothetical protein